MLAYIYSRQGIFLQRHIYTALYAAGRSCHVPSSMTEQLAALLAAVHADPDELHTRMVYADALSEAGDAALARVPQARDAASK